MNELNQLEKDVLLWVIDHINNDALKSQLLSANLIERDWTVVGFHISLGVDKSLEKVDISFPISGPIIKSSGIDCDGGSLIWGEDGYVNGIELYAYGDKFEENLTEYQLMDEDTYNKQIKQN